MRMTYRVFTSVILLACGLTIELPAQTARHQSIARPIACEPSDAVVRALRESTGMFPRKVTLNVLAKCDANAVVRLAQRWVADPDPLNAASGLLALGKLCKIH